MLFKHLQSEANAAKFTAKTGAKKAASTELEAPGGERQSSPASKSGGAAKGASRGGNISRKMREQNSMITERFFSGVQEEEGEQPQGEKAE